MWFKIIEKRRRLVGSKEREVGEILPFKNFKPFIIGDIKNLGGHRFKASG
jgi:hypothetical protein